MNKNLAATLRKLRFEKGDLSQEHVAKKINVSLSTYSRLERSEAEIDLETASKIADLYKITIDELIHMDDPTRIDEPLGVYINHRWAVPVTVALDGTKETLESWIKKLTDINATL